LYTMKKLFLLFIPFSTLLAQPTNVVATATPTQITISYLAPNSSACTLAMSTSNTLSPLVNDLITDSGGTSDLARASTVTNSLNRTVVIGKRNAVLSAMNGYNN